jgi:uncharacterized membrane-anchored protein
MIRLPLIFAAVLTFVGSLPLCAQNPEPTDAQAQEQLHKLAEGLHYKQGEITLKNGLAKINVPAEFRYLDSADTDTVLVKMWGNPPTNGGTLGMLIPANIGPDEPDCVAIIITFEDEGYVKDDDAARINYDDLLKQKKADTAKESDERQKEGYPSIALVGWATPPHYDSVAKKLYWAMDLKFGDSKEHTLNYNIRILGRRGYLVLNAVGTMEQLPEVEKMTPSVLASVNFQEGHRYADFSPKTDKIATYGLAGLIAGGVLAKTGLLAKIFAIIVGAKKLVVVGFAAVVAGIKKLFGRKSDPVA